MIGELEVTAGQLDFGHVAPCAVSRRYLTDVRAGLFPVMTGLAFHVIIRDIFVDFFMRIVTAGATDSAIVGIVTAAVGQTIGLKPYIRGAVRSIGSNLFPGAMALSAKMSGLLCCHCP